MAISCRLRPDHSTLAGFVDKLQGRVELVFAEVLLACHEKGLLSGTHLRFDGLKLPANAAREWSGTFAEARLGENCSATARLTTEVNARGERINERMPGAIARAQ